MFATLLGALPPPPGDGSAGGDVDAQIRTAIRAQETAGLEPITDGRLRDPSFDRLVGRLIARAAAARRVGEADAGRPSDVQAIVDAWRFAAAQTSRAVKQALPGPYSVGRRAAREGLDAKAVTFGVATALRDEVRSLAAAGCPMIEIEETEAQAIGNHEAERELFGEAHRRLTDGIAGTHLSLSIAGGSAWDAGLATVFAGAYASLAVDLIVGPENWNLVTRLPGDRGVIAGVLPAQDSPADAKELLLWAARYAAASRGRGLDRVGLGSAGSWANLTWEAAVRKLERLGEAARIASMAGGENLARELDPRAVNARTAATGRLAPSSRRRRGGSA